jgi:L-threonylcarbamoyladenylate synthase
MDVVPIDPVAPDPATLARAAARLRAGELVAFPTETVYGLGADALDAEAVARIFAAKGRPAWNPVIAHVAHVDQARALTTAWPDAAERLAAACWPGPLTLVLPAAPQVPAIVRAGLPAVGVRIPAHPVALGLIAAAGRPIAAPSANRFTQISPTTAAHVVRGLGDRVPLVLDGGSCPVGIESTVVDLTGSAPTILRPGAIDAERLAELLGHEVATAARPEGETPRLAPGQVDRHYAPSGDVWLFEPTEWGEVARALDARPADGRVGALWLLPRAHPAVTDPIDMPVDAAGYAQALYAALHTLEARGCALLLIERPPGEPAWAGVRDRLARAAH